MAGTAAMLKWRKLDFYKILKVIAIAIDKLLT